GRLLLSGRVVRDGDVRHVLSVEGFIIVRIDTDPLTADAVALRREDRCVRRISDGRRNTTTDEVRRMPVDLVVHRHVRKGIDEADPSGDLPSSSKFPLAFLPGELKA